MAIEQNIVTNKVVGGPVKEIDQLMFGDEHTMLVIQIQD